MMMRLEHRAYDFKIKATEGKRYIFDVIRRKYVVLTPEEWVRQHMVRYMLEVMDYPQALISMEKRVVVNNLSRRYDMVVYDRNTRPWMLVECKAPHVTVGDQAFRQLLMYQQAIQCPYGLITNGATSYCCHMQLADFKWLETLPAFN